MKLKIDWDYIEANKEPIFWQFMLAIGLIMLACYFIEFQVDLWSQPEKTSRQIILEYFQ